MNELLFSYGTLQKDDVQLKIFGRLLKGSKDFLKGYKTSTIEITDESFLVKGEHKYQQTLVISENKNNTVAGTVLDVSTDDLLLADSYEPSNYKRIKAKLASGKVAWIYLASSID